MLRHNRIIFGLVCVMTLWCSHSLAAPLEPAIAQDIEVTAKSFNFDNTKGIALYQGDVVAVQGERTLTGDSLEIYRASKGDINKIIINGNLAKYQGRTEQNKALLTAVAKKITYLPETEYFILEEDAEISQGNEFYRAPRMEYDAKLQKMYSPNSLEGHTSIVLKKSSD